jgi:hypothetical protein
MYFLKMEAAGFLKMLVTICIAITQKTTVLKKLNMTSKRFELRIFLCADRKC